MFTISVSGFSTLNSAVHKTFGGYFALTAVFKENFKRSRNLLIRIRSIAIQSYFLRPTRYTKFANNPLLLQLTLISALVAIGSCGRLEPQYLPPRPGGSGVGASAGAFSGAGSGGFRSSVGSYSGGGAKIPITKYENVNNGDGSYRYR